MYIKPSAAIRQNYNEIAELCRSSQEPVYLTNNGEAIWWSWILRRLPAGKKC